MLHEDACALGRLRPSVEVDLRFRGRVIVQHENMLEPFHIVIERRRLQLWWHRWRHRRAPTSVDALDLRVSDDWRVL